MKNYLYSNYSTKMQLIIFLLLVGLNLFGNNNGLDHIKLNVFVCPDDITIGCCQDYNNTDVTGHPMMTNPDFDYFTYEDSVALNECREGFIFRTWTAYGSTGQFSCDQLITMVYFTDFDGTIQWPLDWEGSCGDQIPFSTPNYEPGFCDQIAHNYNDDTIRLEGSVCMKILRHWKVIDWCKYQPNSGSNLGLWEHIQVLKIIELDEPEITNCSDTLIGAMNYDCTADFTLYKSAVDSNCLVESELSWRYSIDMFNDWSVDTISEAYGNSIEVELKNFPIGTHKIMWTVYDNCGNATSCTELIEVEDGKDPTPICYLSMPTVLMPTENMLEVNARMYVKKGEDNCTDEEDLQYSWSPDPADSVKIFDCDDMGFQFLPLYIIDETGNYDFCFIFTRVINHGSCSGLPYFVGGQITSFSGAPEHDVKISLGNNALNTYVVDTSDQEGVFKFPYVETIAEPGLYCFKEGGKLADITTLDLVYLQKYLLGMLRPVDEADFLKAADVNGDGLVNVADLLMMRDLVLGIEESIDALNPLRMFVRDPANPDHFIEVDAIHELSEDLEIKVIKVGDVSDYFEVLD